MDWETICKIRRPKQQMKLVSTHDKRTPIVTAFIALARKLLLAA